METMDTMEREAPQESLWFLAGVIAVGLGAVFFFGTQEGRQVRRQLLSWTEEAQRRVADIQDVLEVTRQLCAGEPPAELRDLPPQRIRAVQGG